MNTLLNAFPDSVEVFGESYRIVTDFRDWIRYIEMYGSKELTDQEKVQISFEWFIDKPPNSIESLDALKWFLFMGNEQKSTSKKLTLSYDQDAAFIASAFISEYRIDLNEIDYMHWWKFKSLFEGLNDETTIKKYMYYRSVDLSTIKDKDEKKRIAKIQRQIAIKQEVDEADIGAMLWGGM